VRGDNAAGLDGTVFDGTVYDGTVSGDSRPAAAPGDLHATAGRGQVTLDWSPVGGAAGYLVHRAAHPSGPFQPLDHGGGDVLAVPAGPYADTAPDDERPCYAVAAVAGPGAVGPLSETVVPTPLISTNGAASRVTVSVRQQVAGELDRPWQPMIGSEHLSLLLSRDTIGGQVVGDDLRKALRLAQITFGAHAVRAHAILGDDLGVYTEDAAGNPRHDFTGVDRVYDQLAALGLRPVVELSFMPRALARDPARTVFSYGAVISPPRDWGRWAALIHDLTRHLIDRYGRDEVVGHWSFEVWNEPNLDVFWSGTQQEYFRLYDVTAAAVRAADPDLKVGGPASAAAGWIEEFLAHTGQSGAPLDFLSTHTYGNEPLDLRPVLRRHGRAQVPVWWTEWGATPTHFNPVGDTVFAAAFLLRGLKSSLGRVGALAHWVASDHFEELGRPPELFHGGFGLLSVGNLRKPRFWALALAQRLGPAELVTSIEGDGAHSMVEAIAARGDDGRIGVLIWNSTLEQSRLDGDPRLAREIRLRIEAPPGAAYQVTHHRIDADHSNIVPAWERIRGLADWPGPGQWQRLRTANTLDALTPPTVLIAAADGLAAGFTLPLPAVSYLELTPQEPSSVA
jgi:xylan 1,4-beta-xylosidase